jgi:hypothetical protein
MFAVRTSLLAVFTLASCAMEDITEAPTVEAIGCPSWGCNDNGALMGLYSFWEGNTDQLETPQHLKFRDFVIAGVPYKPYVIGDRLIVKNPTHGTREGMQLQGGYFEVDTPTGMFRIRILQVHPQATSPVKFWVGSKTGVETYELTYDLPGGIPSNRNLCWNPPDGDSTEGGDHNWNAPVETILFTGDRYSDVKRLVTDTSPVTTAGWFNFACAGSTLAKLHLNRHTSAGAEIGYTTTKAERTTMIKMYASDHCGDGTVWTDYGTPLRWQNSKGWNKFSGMEIAFESRWTETGAQCLDTHRLGPTQANAIIAHCEGIRKSMKPCKGSVLAPTFPDGAYIDTAVPAP